MSKSFPVLVFLSGSAFCSALSYHVVDLGSYWWTNTSTAIALNNATEVTGDSNVGVGMAFSWSQQRGLHPPGLMSAAYVISGGRAISDAGHVAGFFWSQPQFESPCVWLPNGRFKQLPIPSLTFYGEASGVDSSGEVVGWARGSHPGKAWFWSETLGLVDMGGLMPGGEAEARAINEKGEAVGGAVVPYQNTVVPHAFFWSRKSGMSDLGLLSGYQSSSAWAVNDFGVACGSCSDTVFPQVACLFSVTAPPISLGPVQGWPNAFSTGEDINNWGHVVGAAFDGSRNSGFFYSKATGMREINELLDADSKAAGWVIGNCAAINDHDEIAGLGLRNGLRRAILLVPVQ